MMRPIKLFLFTILFLIGGPVWAENIVIMALFKDKVVLNKDGKRLVLNAGDMTADGLKVVSVNSKRAVISINGKQSVYELGMQIHTSFKSPQYAQIHIEKDQAGMYRTPGEINQKPVNFLVDTGASMLALNMHQARRLGIPYEDGKLIIVETASGQSAAYRVTLRYVSIGQILVRDVEAIVVAGDSPKEILLGMSFLKHLRLENSESIMLLRQKF